MFTTMEKTDNGIERTFAINTLAPLFICEKCLPLIKNAEDPKIINTASALHKGVTDIKKLTEPYNFSGWKQYGLSKLGIIQLTRLLAEEYKNANIGADASALSRGCAGAM